MDKMPSKAVIRDVLKAENDPKMERSDFFNWGYWDKAAEILKAYCDGKLKIVED